MILLPAGARQFLLMYGATLLFVMAVICKGIIKPPAKAGKAFLRGSEYLYAKAISVSAREFDRRNGK